MNQTLLPDIQKSVDTREIHIDRVGIAGVRIPIHLQLKNVTDGARTHPTVATIEMGHSLHRSVKGTHMSRFSSLLYDTLKIYDYGKEKPLGKILVETSRKMPYLFFTEEYQMREYLTHIKLSCPYFIKQTAPVSNIAGCAPIDIELTCNITKSADGSESTYFETAVIVDGKTVCPCSREISDFDIETGKGKGAHAQRSKIRLGVVSESIEPAFFYFEDLAHVCMLSFSSPIYPLLKRPDERHVTMSAYENPKFVEDVIRDCALNIRSFLSEKQGKYTYNIRVQNAESIHYHDAFASLQGTIS